MPVSAEQALGGSVVFAGRTTTTGRLASAFAASVAVAVLGLAAPADAADDDHQYRKVVLVDGRELLAEVLSTEPTGLRMRVPQGETLISFELLLDMTPITSAVYEAQPEWVVYYSVLPDLEKEFVGLLNAIDMVDAQPAGTIVGEVTGPIAAATRGCSHNVRCMGMATNAVEPWMWLVATEPVASGGIALRAKVNKGGDEPNEVLLEDPSRDELWKALHEVLGLKEPGAAPRSDGGVPTPVPQRRKFDESRVVALSFVPVPGVPSLAQRDSAGFALAMGVVIPSTALWIGAVGANGESMLETSALAVGGYYAVTVLANQVAGMRSMNKRQRIGVTAAPTVGGGAQVVLVGADR